jgi:23S rRNA (cytidine2498-2'-O)-methyltransferase
VSTPPIPLHAFLASQGFEDALATELGARGPSAGEARWPSVVTRRGELPAPIDPVFARQQLPVVAMVRGDTASAAAESVFEAIAPTFDADERPFTVHVFTPNAEQYQTLAPLVRPLDAALRATLRERRRVAFRRCVERPSLARWAETLVIQVAVVGKRSLLVSAARPRALPSGGFDIAPWPAGIAPVADDRTAPSRAYGKFEEGLAWLGIAPAAGEVCVDLGGSPGGWAWKTLSRGARVIAVDRTALSPPAFGHPALEMIVGNAFTYRPPSPVDWLLCDVICEPHRTIELADHWMREGLCRRVVATIKFKGKDGYGVLADARTRLAAHGWQHLRLKHLERHHNEAVILAAR